jgi:hypothetical protein
MWSHNKKEIPFKLNIGQEKTAKEEKATESSETTKTSEKEEKASEIIIPSVSPYFFKMLPFESNVK